MVGFCLFNIICLFFAVLFCGKFYDLDTILNHRGIPQTDG